MIPSSTDADAERPPIFPRSDRLIDCHPLLWLRLLQPVVIGESRIRAATISVRGRCQFYHNLFWLSVVRWADRWRHDIMLIDVQLNGWLWFWSSRCQFSAIKFNCRSSKSLFIIGRYAPLTGGALNFSSSFRYLTDRRGVRGCGRWYFCCHCQSFTHLVPSAIVVFESEFYVAQRVCAYRMEQHPVWHADNWTDADDPSSSRNATVHKTPSHVKQNQYEYYGTMQACRLWQGLRIKTVSVQVCTSSGMNELDVSFWSVIIRGRLTKALSCVLRRNLNKLHLIP